MSDLKQDEPIDFTYPDEGAYSESIIVKLGVEVLICGAISRPLAEMITDSGIRLIPFLSGDVEEVIQAFLAGNLPNSAFLMPGCCGRRRRFRSGRGRGAQRGRGGIR